MDKNIAHICKKVIRKIEIIVNKRHAYEYPAENGGWKKQGAVFGDAITGSVFDPQVIYHNGKYRMYVSERKRHGILVTESTDGEHWEDTRIALECGQAGDWDEKVNRAHVCLINGMWWMWYTGQKDGKSEIGVAQSRDGYTFVRIRKEPVMTAEYPFEKMAVMNPCVIWDDICNKFKMWYAAGEQYEPDVICYATSEDGILWEKTDKNPIFMHSDDEYDKCKVGGGTVFFYRNVYYLFYIGYQNVDTARICMAVSLNGVDEWKRIKENPILSPERGNWDAEAVYKASVYVDEKDGKMKLWYNGRKKYLERIGYAINDIKEVTKKVGEILYE